MSENQTVWWILWERASRGADPREPFEVDEIIERVGDALEVGWDEADHLIRMLLDELSRLPEDHQYFALAGNAVVPSAPFAGEPCDEDTALHAYPFEL